MKRFEFLEQWENELVSYPIWMRISIIVSISIIILWVGWEFWVSPLIDDITTASNRQIKLEKDISRINPKIFKDSIAILKHKRMVIRNSIENSKFRLNRLESESYKYKFLWFDENRFLMILKSILEYSVKLGIKIDKIKSLDIQNRDIEQYIKIGKIIKIEGAGSYGDIIKMLYYIDSFKALLNITDIKIWLDNGELKFTIIIVQYGIEL